MNYKVYFEEAKKVGLEALELYSAKESSLSFSLFRGEIESFQVSDTYSLIARGIYQGKFGYCSTEKKDKCTPKYVVEQIKENASINESKEEAEIFKGSERYHKRKVYNGDYKLIPTEHKIALAKEMENALRKADPRIREVEIEYSEGEEEVCLCNSYGLNLKNHVNSMVYYVCAHATDEDGDTKTGYKVSFTNQFDDFNSEKIVNEVVDKTLSQLGGKPCKSGKYKTVLDKKVAASLLSFFLSSTSAEAIAKKSSMLIDKVGEKIASSKLTIEEKPLAHNMFFRSFDDEGVATMNKKIVDRGVLKTYLYDLKNARKFNVEPTGNGYKHGNGKASVSFVNIHVKPGKKSLEQIFSEIGNGIYITSVEGLHAGMNAQSGNFSLQAKGYMIENGKMGSPVTLITIAGNLFDMIKNIKEVANDAELLSSGFTSCSLYIKSMPISGI